ncbi:hypothetical protein [Streptomyces sp. XY332]|uniref:hypothetical protein n=1 Tax=Streptomyces sp. XY332 TaxID=1415561 RepID=UPI000B255421|nr:hypothetical protein [Streptomyces sp. XY332]
MPALPTTPAEEAGTPGTGGQQLAREGCDLPGRAHIEQLPNGTEHRTGVWPANQKQRRGRLDPDQLATLAALGIDAQS